jgi:hypothetical protein
MHWHVIHIAVLCRRTFKRVRVSVVRVPAPWPPVLCAACVVRLVVVIAVVPVCRMCVDFTLLMDY